MSNNPDELIVGGNHSIFVGPVGTPFPSGATILTAEPDEDFAHLGLTQDDGLTLSISYDTATRSSSQLLDPVLRIRTGRDMSFAATLQQFNPVTVPLALGGGAVTETTTGSGIFKYDLPDGTTIDYRAAIIHVVHGAKVGRIFIPKMMVTETSDLPFKKDEEIGLGLTFGVVASGIAAPASFIGNVPFFSAEAA